MELCLIVTSTLHSGDKWLIWHHWRTRDWLSIWHHVIVWITSSYIARTSRKIRKFEPEGSEKHKGVNNNIKRCMKKAEWKWIGEQCRDTEANLRKNNSSRAYQLMKVHAWVGNHGQILTILRLPGLPSFGLSEVSWEDTLEIQVEDSFAVIKPWHNKGTHKCFCGINREIVTDWTDSSESK